MSGLGARALLSLIPLRCRAHTGDIRESAALNVISFLLEEKAKVAQPAPLAFSLTLCQVHVFDPVVEASTITSLFPSATVESSVSSACEDCSGIVVCTEWPEFLSLDWEAIYQKVRKPALVFDGRLILDPARMREAGFELRRIGSSQ